MKKRVLSLVLALLLAACLLAGCKVETLEAVEHSAESFAAATEGEPATPAPAEAPESAPADAPASAAEGDFYDVADGLYEGMDAEEYQRYIDAANTRSPGELQAQDQYGTDPVPEGMPGPVEPGDAVVDQSVSYTGTLSITCDKILLNMDKLNPDKLEILPAEGTIMATKTVTFYKGESAFDVLLRETKNARIHMEHVSTPVYNSSYIKGIGNIYQFDCGELSGWMYNVGGWYPNYGCSRYQMRDGDALQFRYSCDLGRDLGVTWVQQ